MVGRLGYLFFFLLLPITGLADPVSEIDTILNRHKTFLLAEPIENVKIDHLIGDFDLDNNQWKSIDYSDEQKSKWKVAQHLENIKMLALVWNDDQTSWYRNKTVYNIIIRGLDNWAYHKYQNPNWWHNEIGVPQLMRDILVLMNGVLPEEKMKNYLGILDQYKINGTGANLIWSADLGLYYGLLVNDLALIDSAVSVLVAEIKISEGDGLKPDFSFQQHGARLQMYQYGASFLLSNIRIAWELQKSSWAYPVDKLELLKSMLLDGWQWLARGIYTVPNTMDRSATRPNELNKADVRSYVKLFKALMPSKTEELDLLMKIQNGEDVTLTGFKYFPYSDFAAYHHRDFSFFLKTISSRSLSSESINHENLKGKLMNSGETYFMRDGHEYFNMMPVWDWEKLPGITAFSGADEVLRNDFSGSVSDGMIGLSSMKYAVRGKGDDQRVTAKKTWLVYQNYVLCLISDMKIEGVDSVYTILDQSRRRGVVITDKGSIDSTTPGQQNLKWVRHHDFVYFTPDNNDYLMLRAGCAEGNWYAINRGYSSDIIREKVFMPYIKHDPSRQSYAYIVSSASDKATKEIITQQPFYVIANNSNNQSVVLGDGTVAATFYKPSSINLKNGKITVDKPCLLIIGNDKLFISDPNHLGGAVTVKYKNKSYEINLLSNGETSSVVL